MRINIVQCFDVLLFVRHSRFEERKKRTATLDASLDKKTVMPKWGCGIGE